MPNAVEIEVTNNIAILCFNREDALNALTVELARGIANGLIELDRRDDVRGIVLTGAGERSFCAGVDLREARGVQVAEIEEWFGTVCNIYKQILLTEKPVIAALNGVAAGGGFQIALVSDQRVAHPGIKMGQPEINCEVHDFSAKISRIRSYIGPASCQINSDRGRGLSPFCHVLGITARVIIVTGTENNGYL